MSRMIKFIWLVSIVLFLLVLLWVYAYLPQRVGVMADYEGVADTFLSKEIFFYVTLAVFLLVNGILFALRKALVAKTLPARGAAYARGKQSLYADLADWLYGFTAALNFFFIGSIGYLAAFNNPEGLEVGDYWLMVYSGPFLIVVSLVVLVYLFLKKRN